MLVYREQQLLGPNYGQKIATSAMPTSCKVVDGSANVIVQQQYHQSGGGQYVYCLPLRTKQCCSQKPRELQQEQYKQMLQGQVKQTGMPRQGSLESVYDYAQEQNAQSFAARKQIQQPVYGGCIISDVKRSPQQVVGTLNYLKPNNAASQQTSVSTREAHTSTSYTNSSNGATRPRNNIKLTRSSQELLLKTNQQRSEASDKKQSDLSDKKQSPRTKLQAQGTEDVRHIQQCRMDGTPKYANLVSNKRRDESFKNEGELCRIAGPWEQPTVFLKPWF